MKRVLLIILALATSLFSFAKEYHVSQKGGADTNNGSESAPFKTISKAAEFAIPGDIITVYEGVYREWVNPPRGGDSKSSPITYRAAAGEKAHIKGSEVVNSWENVGAGVWKIELDNSFFGEFNPFRELIYGDWFDNWGRKHHLGDVFLNGKSLYEVASREAVNNPEPRKDCLDPEGEKYVWFVEEGDTKVTIWANFQKENPNKVLTEVSARTTCFYPTLEGINYITLRGFEISQAASQWGAPTAEQVGMVATHWNKGWIIENNILHDARCSAITLGKERETGHNVWLNNLKKDGSLHYIEVTMNALRKGWNKENIGSHVVRNNTIYNCEQTGMCGSQGAAFSEVYNNHIYNIWYKRQFSGAEIGGIKFHAAIDTDIHNNRINNCGRGIWLDWMTQGVQVHNNLIYGCPWEDIFLEVNHGPCMVYNNILLSKVSVNTCSDGTLFSHNLMTGSFNIWSDKGRYTPYHLPHSTEVKGLSINVCGDDRVINNICVGQSVDTLVNEKLNYGTVHYNIAEQPVIIDGNTLYWGARPSKHDVNAKISETFNPEVNIRETSDGVYLSFNIDNIDNVSGNTQVNGKRLGVLNVVEAAYEFADGREFVIDTDYSGAKRDSYISGPFATLKKGKNEIKVW